MHDPYSLVKEISIGKRLRIMLWHVDPCTDGTDSSCRNNYLKGEKGILKKIQSDFDFHFKNNYWFYPNGAQIFSTTGTVLEMYRVALWILYKGNRKRMNKFLRKHLPDIIHFSENYVDCIGDRITNKWNYENQEERFRPLARIIYRDILRRNKKWWHSQNLHLSHLKLMVRYHNPRKERTKSNVDENLRSTI